MKLRLLAVGTRMPDWVRAGFEEYARRMPRGLALELTAVAQASGAGAKAAEGARLLAHCAPRDQVVALDERGQGWSSAQLAVQLQRWQERGGDVCLLVGGADGLAPACLERAAQRWSLSPLTLPHMLVRILVAEQLYRACTLLSGHPYHRA
jgi:23S rRNA (pseudouridine1915-N3)-methyltransferase